MIPHINTRGTYDASFKASNLQLQFILQANASLFPIDPGKRYPVVGTNKDDKLPFDKPTPDSTSPAIFSFSARERTMAIGLDKFNRRLMQRKPAKVAEYERAMPTRHFWDEKSLVDRINAVENTESLFEDFTIVCIGVDCAGMLPVHEIVSTT